MKLTIRGHHLLCIKGFQGYGYSEDFVKNMSEINSLRKQKDVTLQLTDSADDICKACPNLKEGICENIHQNKRIVDMDSKVLEHLDSSKEYDSIELFEKIDRIFYCKESVEEICFKCMWHDECLFYQNLKTDPLPMKK